MSNSTSVKKGLSKVLFNHIVRQASFFSKIHFEKKLIISLVFLSFSVTLFAQVVKPEDKLDIAFRYLLSAKDKLADTNALKSIPPRFKIEPTEGFVPGKAIPEKRYDCIIYTKYAQSLKDSGIIIRSVLPTFVTAWVTLAQMEKLAVMPQVSFIEAPQFDKANNDVAVGNTGASLLQAGKLNNTVYKGKGVIVAIFDTGLDWTHFDFRNPANTSKSRVLKIWDQTITPVSGESSPSGFGYGVEYDSARINTALALLANQVAADTIAANALIRERDIDGHGTHVAGTAAGNGGAIPATLKYAGMAPEADIVIVKGGDGSFSTTNIINGITYLQNLAATLGKPIVMNMSLGGQFGPHDGTRNYEIAVDNFTASAPGRAIVISAGNDNGTNIHNRLTLTGAASSTISFTVPAGTTGTDVFEYRVYANDASDVTVAFTAPSAGGTVTATAGQSLSASVLSSNFTATVSNLIEAGNGDRYVDVYVARNGSNTASPAGTWTLSITNNTTNTLTMDGWLYYTNTVFATTILVGGNSEYLVGSPGNATSAITVGSFVGRGTWYSAAAVGNYSYSATNTRLDSISTFSAHGPRRDGVLKPEISAHGQAVISSLSSHATHTLSDIVVVGKYKKNQGTSMSAPVTTGAVALLLQASAGASVSQIKSRITATAFKDQQTESTGATPNTTWGYGKLDVFKAAATLANCSTPDWKLYKYDNSNHSSLDNGTTLTTDRVAVRFTPDISGQLGGAYYHTSTTKTSLIMEVRSNNAGVPGTLLGTVNLPDTLVAQYSLNYVDLNGLNIPVTTGTDYFIIVYRDPASSANWSLRRENTVLDNRSLTSTNGTTWTNPSYDYKIRSVVYNSGSTATALAANHVTTTQDVAAGNLFVNTASCVVIAAVAPNGATPVSGNVTADVWIEPGVPYYGGQPYVQRHYQITPAANASATGRVTLYFTQADFTAFNSTTGSTLDLPANPTDAAGKSNLRIGKYPGNSSNGTGLPGTYSGTPAIIDPADGDIIWNSGTSRWEVSFDVTGFSGFIVQTNATILPIVVTYFSGTKQNGTNVLDWKVACGNSDARFEVERSADGANFNTVGKVITTLARCLQPFAFTDASPLQGNNYYRIKMTENNGAVYYTNIILLQSDRMFTTSVYPTYIKKGMAVQVSFTGTSGSITINDAAGKQVYTHTLRNGVQSITFPVQVSGVYFYRIVADKNITTSGKLIVE